MKKTALILLACTGLLLTACSSDDDNTSEDPQNNGNYFPLALENTWRYANTSQVDGGEESSMEENITIDLMYTENGVDYYGASSDMQIGGLATSVLTQSELTKAENSLILNGELNFDFELQDFPSFSIPFENAILYHKNEVSGTKLFMNTGNISESFQDIPISLTYEIKTIQGDFLESFTVEGQVYEDVMTAQVICDAAVSASIGPLSIDILRDQEIINTTNYYAKDVGLIYSETSINYEVEDLSDFQINLPSSFRIEETQALIDYNVSLE